MADGSVDLEEVIPPCEMQEFKAGKWMCEEHQHFAYSITEPKCPHSGEPPVEVIDPV